MTERELGALVDAAYLPLGGATTIHFIGINAMASPTQCVPPQYHSTRRLARGDMMFVEFTAAFGDFSGQVLRSFTVDAEPTPLFRDLYATAEAAFNAITGVLRALSSVTYSAPSRPGSAKSSCSVPHCHTRANESFSENSIFGP